MRRRYNYSFQGAHNAGVVDWRDDLKRIAPDAHNGEVVTIGDCYLFSAEQINELPAYVTDITGVWPKRDP